MNFYRYLSAIYSCSVNNNILKEAKTKNNLALKPIFKKSSGKKGKAIIYFTVQLMEATVTVILADKLVDGPAVEMVLPQYH